MLRGVGLSGCRMGRSGWGGRNACSSTPFVGPFWSRGQSTSPTGSGSVGLPPLPSAAVLRRCLLPLSAGVAAVLLGIDATGAACLWPVGLVSWGRDESGSPSAGAAASPPPRSVGARGDRHGPGARADRGGTGRAPRCEHAGRLPSDAARSTGSTGSRAARSRFRRSVSSFHRVSLLRLRRGGRGRTKHPTPGNLLSHGLHPVASPHHRAGPPPTASPRNRVGRPPSASPPSNRSNPGGRRRRPPSTRSRHTRATRATPPSRAHRVRCCRSSWASSGSG